jgi:hypothetical protein
MVQLAVLLTTCYYEVSYSCRLPAALTHMKTLLKVTTLKFVYGPVWGAAVAASLVRLLLVLFGWPRCPGMT